MRSTMHLRIAVILALLATGALLGACGSSVHSTATTAVHRGAPTGAHAGAPAGASRPPTRAQALAFARAVNLTAADVPGLKASKAQAHQHETAAEKELERELMHCTGASSNSGKGLAEVSSQDFKFEHGIIDLSVNSEVSVSGNSQTPALIAKELGAIRGNHIRACLSHYLNLLFKGQKYQGATVSPVSILQGTPPAPGASGSFGWRITVTITVHGIRIPFYLDILGFGYGRAEVSLLSSGVLHPFPAAIQQRLFMLLLTRAKTHTL
ncbi:MAG TPA: hypothetical protein VJ996_04405 [Solirubrobacteraceae bacterium]|nr:hypothetical protein [Solirubrobacteraceae bacterium]